MFFTTLNYTYFNIFFIRLLQSFGTGRDICRLKKKSARRGEGGLNRRPVPPTQTGQPFNLDFLRRLQVDILHPTICFFLLFWTSSDSRLLPLGLGPA